MGIPGPGDLLRVAEQSRQAVTEAIALVPRLVKVVDQVEVLIERVDALVDGIEDTAARADATVTASAATAARAGTLVADLEPTMAKLQPILETLARTTSPAEVEALVQLIDQLPALADRLDTEIMPIITTMASVSPDLRDLLQTSKELNELIANVPGMGRVRRKLEDEHEQDETERPPDQQPATVPDHD